MDKQPVGQLPDLTQSNNDDEIMVITDSEHNQLKKEKISDFITDLTSTNENNALIKGTDNKLFVTDFGNASNITEGTLPTSVLPEIPLGKIPDIPKDKLPQIETTDLPNSGVTAGEYIYPTNMQVNSKGQIVSVENGTTADITKEQIDTVAARPLSDNACTQEKFPDEYSYWVDQAHSTFDLSKFEVVGSPTISDDGVLSGVFNNSTYLKTTVNKSILLNKSWSVTSGKYISSSSTIQIIDLSEPGFGDSGVVNFNLSNKNLVFKASFDSTTGGAFITKALDTGDFSYLIARLDFNYSTGTYSLYYDIGNGWGLAGTYTPTGENKQLYFIVNSPSSSINIYLTHGNTTLEYDLKYYTIWVDAQPVFSGNKTGIDTINGTSEIPYTETTDGTKVVDAAYFDRVQSCREQTGQALYLTLDEQNQQYYLPQGTVSGMISQNKQGLEELDAKIEQIKAQIGFTLFDTKITDHVLSGNDAVGWALQGSLVTNIYTDAVSNIASAYASGTATTYREISCKRATDGRYIADIAQKEAIDTLFEDTGVADFYILDSANNQFYLPKSIWFSQMTADSDLVNQYNASALPNITSNATGFGVGNTLNWANGGATSVNYSLEAEKINGGNQVGRPILFNASRSSSVYKSGQKYVQPPSSNKLLYYKVGNTLTNDTAINIGNMSNIISNLSTKTQIDKFVINGNTWYRKYSDGFVEQAGLATGLSANTSTINLPVSMANTNYMILLSLAGSTGGSSKNVGGIRSSSSSFTLYAESSERNAGIFWYVAGQGA